MTIATNVVLPFRDKSVTMGPRPPILASHEILPFGFVHTQSFGSPTLTPSSALAPSGYVNPNRFGGTGTARITLNPAGFADTDLFGAPTVTGGVPTRTLRPFGFVNPNYFGSPSLLPGRTLYPAGWDDRTPRYIVSGGAYVLVGDKFGSPTLTYTEAPHRLVATSLIQIEPWPPGQIRPPIKAFSTGFVNAMSLYYKASTTTLRLFNQEAYGYSTLSMANPEAPSALVYRNLVDDGVTLGGDGSSIVFCSAVSEDGQRVLLSLGGPADAWFTVVGRPSNEQWTLKGSFSPRRGSSAVIQYVAGRYIAYLVTPSAVNVIDITTLPVTFSQTNMTSERGKTSGVNWDGGSFSSLCGSFYLYQSGSTIKVVDVSSPGAIGNITNACPVTTVTGADFTGGRSIASFAASLDAVNTDKLWILVELIPLAGEKSPTYGLLYVSRSGMAKTIVNPLYRIPAASGENWLYGSGASAVMGAHLGRVHVVIPALSNAPVADRVVLYATTVEAWGSVNSTVPPAATSIPPSTGYVPGHASPALSTGGVVYAYAPCTALGFAIKMVEA